MEIFKPALGALYLGTVDIDVPPSHPEVSPQQELKAMVSQALDLLPLSIGSSMDEYEDFLGLGILTRRELNEILEKEMQNPS